MKNKRIIFVPRTEEEVTTKLDAKIGTKLDNRWGNPDLCTLIYLDTPGQFNFDLQGKQVYVIGGHGTAGLGTVFWQEKTNTLTAEVVAQRTAAKFPHGDCDDVAIKVYSCHSGEGGDQSFAAQFATAFKPTGCTGTVRIFGYKGAISIEPHTLTAGNVQDSMRVYSDADVRVNESHRWTKLKPFYFWGRASRGRSLIETRDLLS